jgi:hypothetical protein
MSKLLIGLALLIFPVLAQVTPLLPVQQVNLGEMTAPPAVSRWNARKWELEEGNPPGRTLYRWSMAAVVVANATDVASSWRQPEANPLVAGGGAQFGATSAAIKTGLVAASLVIQHATLRHRPDLYKKVAWLNFAMAGLLGGVASYNMGVR